MHKVFSAEYESTLSFWSAMGLGKWQPIVGLDAKLSYWNSRHCSLPNEFAITQSYQPVCAFLSRRFSAVNIKEIWLFFRWHDDTYSKFAHFSPDGGCHCASEKDKHSHFYTVLPACRHFFVLQIPGREYWKLLTILFSGTMAHTQN